MRSKRQAFTKTCKKSLCRAYHRKQKTLFFVQCGILASCYMAFDEKTDLGINLYTYNIIVRYFMTANKLVCTGTK